MKRGEKRKEKLATIVSCVLLYESRRKHRTSDYLDCVVGCCGISIYE